MGGFGSRLQIRRDRPFFAFAIATHLVGVGFHRDQVDHAFQVLLAADGNLYRDNLAAKSVAQAFQRGLIIGALAVHAADYDHARQLDLFRILPDFFGNHFHAGNAIDNDNGGLRGGHGDPGLVREQREAGGIEQRDLSIAPFQGGNAHGHRHLPGDFFFVVVGDGGTIVHQAQLGRGSRGVKQGRNQRGFSGMRVADHHQVADVFAFINLQGAPPSKSGAWA